MQEKLNAAIIGVGNIGFRFDLDPMRKGMRSHAAMYGKSIKTKLAGVVDIDRRKLQLFNKWYPRVPAFRSVKELMRYVPIDIVSICTPPQTHWSVIREMLSHKVKAVFCEKPLASTIQEGAHIIKTCSRKHIVLAVNHTRRWDLRYRTVENIIDKGKIGKIIAINALYSGGIFNIGSHLVDTVRMFTKNNPIEVSGTSGNMHNQDPDVSGWIRLKGGIICDLICTGKREDLVFEIDVIGTDGRIRILENGEKIEMFSFVSSERYSGYRELAPVPLRVMRNKNRLSEALNNIISVIENRRNMLRCSGREAFKSLVLTHILCESAKKGGKPLRFRG